MTMASGFRTCGGSHLARKSELVRDRARLGGLRDILLVEDEAPDAERLTATLRVLLGYDAEIRWASTIGDAVDSIIAMKPSIVFLDDILKPSTDASQSIPLLRGVYQGPIIVVSGLVTRARRASLLVEGASDVIHKDDVDSVRVGEAIARLDLPEPGDSSAS